MLLFYCLLQYVFRWNIFSLVAAARGAQNRRRNATPTVDYKTENLHSSNPTHCLISNHAYDDLEPASLALRFAFVVGKPKALK